MLLVLATARVLVAVVVMLLLGLLLWLAGDEVVVDLAGRVLTSAEVEAVE